MNDTPQGDGNTIGNKAILDISCIRMNDTPQGDGNTQMEVVEATPKFKDKNE